MSKFNVRGCIRYLDGQTRGVMPESRPSSIQKQAISAVAPEYRLQSI
jgi:hypothetical protein